jgi:two-component system sensor histidine kinase/response regulator
LLFDSLVRILGGESDVPHGAAAEPTDTFKRLVSIRGARVLLVEDNDMNQQVATELLADAGFRVDLAENGAIAVDKVRHDHFDLVLMDMQMPVMNGVTATLEIRKDRRFDALPIVAMTANAMPDDRDRCIAAGMNDHMAKPIEPDALWTLLLKWIPPRHAPLADAPAVAPSAADGKVANSDLPTAIDGLDMVNGLRLVLGKKALYLEMLRKFTAGQKATVRGIFTALTSDDRDTAQRLAHTLKGVAANIGAGEVQRLATRLETAIRERAPRREIEARTDAIRQPLERLIAQLDKALPPVARRAAVSVDREELKSLGERLDALLVENNVEAGALLDAHADLFCAGFPGHYAGIENAIHAFNFRGALDELRKATAAS